MRKTILGLFAVLFLASPALLSGCSYAAEGQMEPAARELAYPDAAAEQRTVVVEVYGIEFVNPYDTRKVITGEKVKAASDHSNIYLEDENGKIEPVIPPEAWQDFQQSLKSLPAGKQAELVWSASPRPVNGGRHIVYHSNRSSILSGSGETVSSIYMIGVDGSSERMLLDGEQYGSVRVLDTVGTRVYAQGEDLSLIVMDSITREMKRFFLKGQIDAVSKDGNYVLYRKVKDGYVLPELYVFDLLAAKAQPAGPVPDDYFFAR